MQFLRKLIVGLSLVLIGSQAPLNAMDSDQWHQMHMNLINAINNADMQSVEFALNMGAQGDYVRNGKPILITAVENYAQNPTEMFFIIRKLLDRGANINAKDAAAGNTALHAAIQVLAANEPFFSNPMNQQLAENLIDALEYAGADPYQRNRVGKSAYDLVNSAVNNAAGNAPYLRSIKEKWSIR